MMFVTTAFLLYLLNMNEGINNPKVAVKWIDAIYWNKVPRVATTCYFNFHGQFLICGNRVICIHKNKIFEEFHQTLV